MKIVHVICVCLILTILCSYTSKSNTACCNRVLCISPGPSAISSEAALLLEWQTGTVLFEKCGFTRMHPASLTKMMTALLALERGRLDDMVRVSNEAATQPGSSMNLREGDVFSLEDLLYGLMLVSGNDSAWAIAEHISKGSPTLFFNLMNQRAKQLGAINTRFENPHGLTDPNHYTTAFDLALIARTCLNHPYFKHFVSTKQKDVIEGESNVVLSLENTNRLLWLLPGADGVKTGTTHAAGQCLVASAVRDGMQLLSVVLNSQDRWHDTSTLLEYGFNNFRFIEILSAGSTIIELPVFGSDKKTLPINCNSDLNACVPKHSFGLRIKIDVPTRMFAPCSGGTIIGQATLLMNKQIVGHSDLIAGDWLNVKTPLRIMAHLALQLIKFLSYSMFI